MTDYGSSTQVQTQCKETGEVRKVLGLKCDDDQGKTQVKVHQLKEV
jgi:hypothetical protein